MSAVFCITIRATGFGILSRCGCAVVIRTSVLVFLQFKPHQSCLLIAWAAISPFAGSGRACAPSLSSPWPSRWPAGPAAQSEKQQGAPVNFRSARSIVLKKTHLHGLVSPAQPVFSCRGRSHPGCCILVGTACTGRAWRTASVGLDTRMQSYIRKWHWDDKKDRMRLTASRISNFFFAWRTLICQKKVYLCD